MKVLDVFQVRGHGLAAVVKLGDDVMPPAPGASVVRASDGARWTIAGVERFAIPPRPGETVSLLLRGEGEPRTGDDVSIAEGSQ